jgi:hypothetical protein
MHREGFAETNRFAGQSAHENDLSYYILNKRAQGVDQRSIVSTNEALSSYDTI